MNSSKSGRISLAHGSGGRKMHRLIQEVFIRHFANPVLKRQEDAAVCRLGRQRVALTTDSFVVQPLFFPGGDIGKLAVSGTVNDLAVMGAEPKLLTCGFIISDGFPLSDLDRICRSMARTARRAGVSIVTGDTKVISDQLRPPQTGFGTPDLPGPAGESPGFPEAPTGEAAHRYELFINTAGLGIFGHPRRYGAEQVRAGDQVIVSGSIGDHEAAIVLARGEFEFRSRLQSDCAPLNGLIRTLVRSRAAIRMMRDPTRGGIATVLNEVAEASGLGIVIDEARLVVRPEVRGVCELLGFDPLYLACEGRVLVVVAPQDAARSTKLLRQHPLGREATVIAQVTDTCQGVWLRTRLGARRPILMLEGQQLPRIC